MYLLADRVELIDLYWAVISFTECPINVATCPTISFSPRINFQEETSTEMLKTFIVLLISTCVVVSGLPSLQEAKIDDRKCGYEVI